MFSQSVGAADLAVARSLTTALGRCKILKSGNVNMGKRISISRETGEEISPIRIMKKDGEAGIVFRPDRLFLCIQGGQCMAICPAQSILGQ